MNKRKISIDKPWAIGSALSVIPSVLIGWGFASLCNSTGQGVLCGFISLLFFTCFVIPILLGANPAA